MVCETFTLQHTLIHRLDPRGRVVAAVAFSVLIAVSGRFSSLGASLAGAVFLCVLARLPLGALLKRLAAVNAFVLLLVVVLPLTTPGTILAEFGPLAFSREGLLRAVMVGLKANAIVLTLTGLLGTMEVVELGHALSHLRVPDKLAHLFLFTIRYVDLMHHEYSRLRSAMRVRCFRPGMNRRTYRALAHLVGMLLVRSFDRSERVLAAMKCRAFRGRFYVLRHFHFHRRDAAFGVLAVVLLVFLSCAEWM